MQQGFGEHEIHGLETGGSLPATGSSGSPEQVPGMGHRKELGLSLDWGLSGRTFPVIVRPDL